MSIMYVIPIKTLKKKYSLELVVEPGYL